MTIQERFIQIVALDNKDYLGQLSLLFAQEHPKKLYETIFYDFTFPLFENVSWSCYAINRLLTFCTISP